MIIQEIAIDDLGNTRTIMCLGCTSTYKLLQDSSRNIHTFDFRSHYLKKELLPGKHIISINFSNWDQAGVSAHANLAEIADFLKQELLRDGIDDAGKLPYTCTVNYGYEFTNSLLDKHQDDYLICYWTGLLNQIVFGQKRINGQLLSLAAQGDIVAHEVFHGITRYTGHTDGTFGLQYARESGALNESYSDIFAIIFVNFHKPDTNKWNWEIGSPFGENGEPIRDFSHPSRFKQPEKYTNYEKLPAIKEYDWGGVHINSGIHNKAVYNILTAKDTNGKNFFTPKEVLLLFYKSLIAELSETSNFKRSREGVLIIASLQFRNDPQRSEKLQAIREAFDDVGIR